MGTVLGALAFAVLLVFAISFHELGHFLTARWAGVKVRQFFVGFGPTLWSRRGGPLEVVPGPDGRLVERPETEYGVKALPLGGFVKVLGMSPFEEVAPEDFPRSFRAAPAWKRAVVLAAGSATHVASGFVVLVCVLVLIGMPPSLAANLGYRPAATLRVGSVSKEVDGRPAPARAAGLRAGDEVVAVDGRRVSDWEQVRRAIRSRPGRPVRLTLRSGGGRAREVEVTPLAVTRDGETVGLIGVAPVLSVTRLGPAEALGASARILGRMVADFVSSAPKAFNPRNLGLVPGRPPSNERAVSVLGAGRIAASLAARGQVALFLFFFVQLNVVIALVNLLPLPPLDGGHLLVLAIEKLRGKPVDQRALVPIMAVVMSLLLILFATLLLQDILFPVDPFG